MEAKAHQTQIDIMTPERLRAYWFGQGRVPFWNYDPAQLTMGLEIEYFIARIDGDEFTLATKNQYLDVVSHLMKDSGYTDRGLRDQPGRVSKDTKFGFIAIKPDFAWHILEIALPPRGSIEEIRELLEVTFSEVDAALRKVGLERLDMSCLPDVPDTMDLVELDRLSGYKPYVKNDDIGDALGLFPALIVATHVHINCSSEDGLEKIPSLYQLDVEAQRLFTRAHKFRNLTNQNIRTVFYEQAFGPKYTLRTTPAEIPASLVDYARSMNLSDKIFPHDKFFPARDMSYIRPTRHGTFEFRSSCSYRNLDTILKIAKFRRDQVLEAFADIVSLGSGVRK